MNLNDVYASAGPCPPAARMYELLVNISAVLGHRDRQNRCRITDTALTPTHNAFGAHATGVLLLKLDANT